MTLGSGSALTYSGTGIVNANELGGAALLSGTLTNADFCTYASSGTLLNCSTGSSGSGSVALTTSPSLTTPAIAGGSLSGTFSGAPTFSGGLDLGAPLLASGVQVLYLPNQSSFNGTLFYGNGGGSLTHVSGSNGYYNTGIGLNALYNNTTGNYNTGIGYGALYSNTTGTENTGTGWDALYSNTTGNSNIGIGWEALYSNTTGNYNIGIGWATLYHAGAVESAGSFVVGISYTILSVGTTDFTLIGASSNTVGVVFTATGAGSGTGTAAPNVENDIGLGYESGLTLTSGSNDTFLGVNTQPQAGGDSNEIVIGANATGGGSNTTTIGNSSTTAATIYGALSVPSGLPIGDIAAIGTNTIVANVTNGSASPTAVSVSGCSAAGDALIWTTNTGPGCNTSITASAVPFSGITTGTNTAATMVVGSGASLGVSGSGTIAATAAPLSGITGFGTGVATALGVNVGSSGAFITYDGALGTPSSGTLTHASGLPIGGVTGWGTGVAAALADATNGSGGLITYGPGTNYAPVTSGSSILYGNGAGGFNNATVGSGLSFSGGVLSASGSELFNPLVVDSPSSSGFQGVQLTSNAGFAEVNSYHNGTSYGPLVLYVGCQDTSADYTAIYDAYQEIAPTGGRIQLAAGNCDIPSGDSIGPFSSDTTLVGAGYYGAGTFIRFAGSDTTSAFLIGAHSSADGTDCQQADNVAATFTGAISGTTLTATGITGGVILPGLTITGTGVTGSPTVTALLGGNQFTISVSQTVGSESMNATGCTQMVATEVGDLGMAAGSKTGGYAFDVNGASQVKIHDIYDAAPGSWDVLYGQYFNTLQFRNIAAYAQDTSSLGKLIYLYQPCVNSGGNCTNGNSRSDVIDIENVTINGQDEGYNVGLWVDGWINTVRAYHFAILDVGFGVVTENTQSLNRTYEPNSFQMRDLEVDHPGVGCSASLPGNGVYFGAGWALYILASDINDAGGNSTCSGSFPLVVDPGADTVTIADTGLHDTNYGMAYINGTNVTLSGIRGYDICDATASCDGITLTSNSTNTLISDTTIGNWKVTGGSTFRNGVSINSGAGMVSLANNNYLGASNASVYNDSSNTISMVGGISGAGAAITGTTCAGGGTLC